MTTPAAQPGCLLIRADADATIGSGHVLRGLALAGAWRGRGGHVVLISHALPAVLQQRAQAAGFKVWDPGGRYPDPADLAGTMQLAKSANAGGLVLDGYFLDTRYQVLAGEAHCPVLVMDDHRHLENYHADLLLNQNLGASAEGYVCNEACKLLLGSSYALLRPEFLATVPRDRAVGESPHLKLLVTMGGGDAAIEVPRLLSALDDPDLRVTVAAGHAPQNLAALQRWARFSPLRPHIVVAGAEMPQLMNLADVVLSGAGSTAWELAYLGVPGILVELADNQKAIAAAMADAGAAYNLGLLSASDPWQVATHVGTLRDNPARRLAMSNVGRKLVDGRGAERVVDALLAAAQKVEKKAGVAVSIAIIDYGMGNLRSVANAVAALGGVPALARTPDDLAAADAVILPGVGAFADGMRQLHAGGWIPALEQIVHEEKTPFLGICLGMQLLAARGSEHGDHPGLGWLPGTVTRLPDAGADVRVPHIGWNSVRPTGHGELYAGFNQEPDFYFIHSYRFEPDDESVVSGWCTHGERFAASVEQDNIQAVQFHPEKSQAAGMSVLRNFLQRVEVGAC